MEIILTLTCCILWFTHNEPMYLIASAIYCLAFSIERVNRK